MTISRVSTSWLAASLVVGLALSCATGPASAGLSSAQPSESLYGQSEYPSIGLRIPHLVERYPWTDLKTEIRKSERREVTSRRALTKASSAYLEAKSSGASSAVVRKAKRAKVAASKRLVVMRFCTSELKYLDAGIKEGKEWALKWGEQQYVNRVEGELGKKHPCPVPASVTEGYAEVDAAKQDVVREWNRQLLIPPGLPNGPGDVVVREKDVDPFLERFYPDIPKVSYNSFSRTMSPEDTGPQSLQIRRGIHSEFLIEVIFHSDTEEIEIIHTRGPRESRGNVYNTDFGIQRTFSLDEVDAARAWLAVDWTTDVPEGYEITPEYGFFQWMGTSALDPNLRVFYWG